MYVYFIVVCMGSCVSNSKEMAYIFAAPIQPGYKLESFHGCKINVTIRNDLQVEGQSGLSVCH